MARRVFISYNYQDDQIAGALPSMRRNQFNQLQSRFVYVPGEKARAAGNDFGSESRRVMQGCDAAVFLIGGSSQHSPHLKKEAELSIERGLPIVVARLAGSHELVPAALRCYPQVVVRQGDLARALHHLERMHL